MCKAGDNFNLSFESLTSRDALRLLCDVQVNQPEIWTKITTTRGHAQVDEGTGSAETLSESPYEDDEDFDDDTSVPLDAIVAGMGSAEEDLPEGLALNEDGSLQRVNAAEVYETEGSDIDEDGHEEEEEEELGRGKRRKQPNRQYEAFWRDG